MEIRKLPLDAPLVHNGKKVPATLVIAVDEYSRVILESELIVGQVRDEDWRPIFDRVERRAAIRNGFKVP